MSREWLSGPTGQCPVVKSRREAWEVPQMSPHSTVNVVYSRPTALSSSADAAPSDRLRALDRFNGVRVLRRTRAACSFRRSHNHSAWMRRDF
jgi:hypothetical protein